MGCFATSDTKPKALAIGSEQKSNDLDRAMRFAMQKGGEMDSGLSMQLELHFSCQNLKNMDVGSPTDSAVAVYMRNSTTKQYYIVGRTELITDNLNPIFVKTVVLEYLFEERQEIKISVFHLDDTSDKAPVEQKLIGSVELCIHDVVRSSNRKKTMPLVNPDLMGPLGDITISGDEKKSAGDTIIKFQFQGENLPMELAFYRIYKQRGINDFVPILESETSKRVGRVHAFKPLEMTGHAFHGDDEKKEGMIEIFEWSSSGSHISRGKRLLTKAQMLVKGEPIVFPNASYNLRILQSECTPNSSFLDYIFSGLEIALFIAVDFTLSNKDPSRPDSLHYFDMSKNQYLQAISSVSRILENYDSDKRFSLLGFGARAPGLFDTTSHCFALNGDIFHPEVVGIQGVIESYKNALSVLKLHGPTNFSYFLDYLNSMVEYEVVQNQMNKYYIMLVITDGDITDLNDTIDQVVRATALPISIIIVGVGDESFEAMHTLDADEKPLYSDKFHKFMERDIVQFVPFREFKNNPVELAKQTLEEIPEQLVGYMKSKNKKPIKEQMISLKHVSFFEAQQSNFKNTLLGMGFDQAKIDEMTTKGMPMYSIDLFRTHAFDPAFRNQLAELNAIYK